MYIFNAELDPALYMQFTDTKTYVYLYMAFVVAVLLFVRWLNTTKFCYYLRAINGNETAAESAGINAANYKLWAYMLSAAIVSLAGSLYMQFMRYTDPSMILTSNISMMIVLVTVMDSRALRYGPLIGAIVLTYISEYTRVYLSHYNGLDMVIYGVLVILIVFVYPRWSDFHSRQNPQAPGAQGCSKGGASKMSNYILQVNDATKKFSGLMANEGITFDVGVGEILGLVGPNGAGKTTLFNSLSGVHQLTRGTITFDGQDITKLSSHQICKLGIGRTFQIPQAIVTLSVEENVLIGALCHTNNMKVARKHAHETIEFCGLAALADKPAAILNVAQKKRLEIARAYATDPKLHSRAAGVHCPLNA